MREFCLNTLIRYFPDRIKEAVINEYNHYDMQRLLHTFMPFENKDGE